MLTSKPGLELFTPGLEFQLHELIRRAALGKTRTLSEPRFSYCYRIGKDFTSCTAVSAEGDGSTECAHRSLG